MTRNQTSERPTERHFLSLIPWEKLVTWALLIGAIYLLRHLFAIFFMTFVLTYVMRGIVERLLALLSPRRERLWLDHLLSILCFLLLLLGVYGIGSYIGPRLINQGENLLVRLARMQPDEEFNKILTKTVGSYLFRREFGTVSDPRYEQAFRSARRKGLSIGAYEDFPALEAAIEQPFDARVIASEEAEIAKQIGTGGPRDREFRTWFLESKAPNLYRRKRRHYQAEWEEKYREFAGFVEGAKDLALLKTEPEFEAKRDEQIMLSILKRTYEDEKRLTGFVSEWKASHLKQVADELKDKEASTYARRFQDSYEDRARTDPSGYPYHFDDYMALRNSYRQGKAEFTKVLAGLRPEDKAEQLKQDRREFEDGMKESLAKQWTTGPVATRLKTILASYAQSGFKTAAAGIRESVSALVTVPFQLALSILLSIFITFDIPKLRRGIARLGTSRLQRIYREIAPGLVSLGCLMGRAFQAQGVIAFVNSVLTFAILLFLGIQNAAFLAAIVFFCSFIPVLGVVLSAVPIAMTALIQPAGSPILAIQALAAILVIHLIEASILNPKILGDMLHLHPVVVLAVLAIGEHFFGVWGLLLAVPVTVYLLRHVIFQEPIPGFSKAAEQTS